MENIVVEEIQPVFGAKITAIGVGGGGSNAISNLVDTMGTHQCVKIVAANTDKQHLDGSPAHYKIRLGEQITRGLGAGMRPEVGREAAEESREEIREVLEGSDIVFIATGLGGGTGTGASPVIAEIAKELGALTVSIVTKPFRGEGPKKAKVAEEGLTRLREVSDSIIVVPNEKLLTIIPKNLGMKESYKIVDDVLVRAVSGIASVMLNYEANNMNVDFADIKTVMSHKGLALMGIGEYEGESAATEAVKNALASPLLDSVSIQGAMGILVNFETHPNYSFFEFGEAQIYVQECAHPDADVKFGTISREDMPENYVRVTIIATGFEKDVMQNKEEKKQFQEEKQKQQLQQAITTEIHPRELFNSNLDQDNLDIPTVLRRPPQKS